MNQITVGDALTNAVEFQKAGKIKEAEKIYRAILVVQPEHPGAHHNLGVMFMTQNKWSEALFHLKIANDNLPGDETRHALHMTIEQVYKQDIQVVIELINQGKYFSALPLAKALAEAVQDFPFAEKAYGTCLCMLDDNIMALDVPGPPHSNIITESAPETACGDPHPKRLFCVSIAGWI